jgi:hypothetical protein
LIILRDVENLIIEGRGCVDDLSMSKEQEIKQLGVKVKDKFGRYL